MTPNARSSLALAVIGAVVLSSVAIGSPAQAAAPSASTQAAADATASFVVDPLMDSPHAMRVEARFEVDPSVSDFTVRLFNDTTFGYATTIDSASGYSVSKTENFIVLEHTGETATPSVTYTVRKGPGGIGRGNPQPMIAGEDWVVFSFKGVTELGYPHDVTVEATTRVRTDRPVTRGNSAILVGERTLYNHSGAKQDFTLVVPEAADMVADREAVLDLMDTTTQLFPGETPGERTYVFVLPENAVGEAPTGLSLSPDVFVAARSRLNQAGHRSGRAAQSVWAHEMVHVQHSFYSPPPSKMRWISEGHADYVAAYASYIEGIITFDRFYNWTRYGYPGEEEQVHDDVLSDPSTHDGSTLYSKGRRVTLALDAKIRRDTGGNRTVFDVFYLLDQTDDGVSLPEFKAAVEQVAGRSYDDWIDRYVTTSAAPTAPRNESLFDSMPESDIEAAEFSGGPEPEPFDVTVTYHVEPLPDRSDTVRVRIVARSERLSDLRILVTNDTAGGFETYVVRTSGFHTVERDHVLSILPNEDLDSNTASVTYVMTRAEGFPPAEEYRSVPQVLVDGVSFGPETAEVEETVELAGDAGDETGAVTERSEAVSRTASDGEDGMSEPAATGGQPGFTAVMAVVALLVTILGVRHRVGV